MHTQKFKIITIMITLLFMYCCVKTVTYLSPNERIEIKDTKKIIVTLQDGTEWKLRNASIQEDRIIGYTKNKSKKEIELSQVKSVKIEKKDYSYVFFAGGVVIIAAILFHKEANAPAPPPAPQWD